MGIVEQWFLLLMDMDWDTSQDFIRDHLHDERERESERIKTTSTLPTGKLISYICSIASGAQLGYAAHNQISNMYFVMWSFIRFQKIEIHLKKTI